MTIFELEQQLKVNTHRFYPVASKWVVYFLLRENHIVYIGKSSNRRYLGRIRSHLKNKHFDAYHVLPVEMSEAECYRFETSLISTIRPEYNVKDCRVDIPAIHRGIDSFLKAQNVPINVTKQIRAERLSLLMLFSIVSFLSFLFLCLFSFVSFFAVKNTYDFGIVLISFIGVAISINGIIRAPLYYRSELKKIKA